VNSVLLVCAFLLAPDQSSPITGACCLEGLRCEVLLEPDCISARGIWHSGRSCEPDPCEQPALCCYLNNECTITSRDVCEAQGGFFFPEHDECDLRNTCSNLRATCCFPDGRCQIILPPFCEQRGGIVGIQAYDCYGMCSPDHACCFPDHHCEMLPRALCELTGFYGFTDTCDPNPCPAGGACCLSAEDCRVFRDEWNCQVLHGVWHGLGTICPPEPPCVDIPTGACCIYTYCEVRTREGCHIYDYRGDGTTCPPDPPCTGPPTGACCFSPTLCELRDAHACELLAGVYRGDGTPCPPDPPCEAMPTGACCIEETCRVLTEHECLAPAWYLGDGVSCEGFTCVDPVKQTSWGRIKLSFR
jgi:hypothetical protein